MPVWHRLLDGCAAAVDWPAAAFWPEISAAFPDATVLLSVRDSESWWQLVGPVIHVGQGVFLRGTNPDRR